MAPIQHDGPLALGMSHLELDTESEPKEADRVVEFGPSLLKDFLLDPKYRNLNHASFGAIPREIQAKLREYQDRAEAKPDVYIRYEYPAILDESRAELANLLSAPVDTIVIVSNATTGINTVLRNLTWNAEGKDEILYFSTIYGGCAKSIDYIVDSHQGLVSSREIALEYPLEDDVIVSRFKKVVQESNEAGKRPLICLFDTVSSLPGVRFPFEKVTEACRELGILSLVDGAQGVGLIHIDLGAFDPDFFVSNCHKWLHVPRGCAVFYVPQRNQHLITSTLPTSHGYVSATPRFNPLPPNNKPQFVANFEFVGTLDCSPYSCVKDSIRWRREVLGGESRILEYIQRLAKDGGRKVAEILGTTVMDNDSGTLTNCGMVNVALPMVMVDDEAASDQTGTGDVTVPRKLAFSVTQWMLERLMSDYNTFIALFANDGRWWTRLSAQVYLNTDDFEWAARTLKDLCERVRRREYEAAITS